MSNWNPTTLGVLVVDDQPQERSLLKKLLKDLQVQQIFEARDGSEALKLLDSAPELIHVVLCDWNMPAMNGIELLRQIRSAACDVPFVMITGRADRDSVIEAKDAGVTTYLAKPFSSTKLEAKLRGVMARKNEVN